MSGRSRNIEVDIVASNKASSVIKKLEKDTKNLGKTFAALDRRMEQAFDVNSGQITTSLSTSNVHLRQMVENTENINRELREMRKELDGVNAKTKKASENVKKADGGWKQMTGTLRTVRSLLTGVVAAFGLQQLIQVGTELVKLGAQADAVAVSYKNLSKSVGASGQDMLARMRDVSKGTIRDTTLMETANAIMLSTGERGLEALPQLLEVARASALATGKSFDYVFKTLVDGVSRGEPRLIDNANIYIKIGDAVEAYAKTVGKTVDELDDLDRRFATLNAVMSEAPGIVKKFGDSQSRAELNVNRASAATSNLKEQVGAFLAEMADSSGAVKYMQRLTDATAINRYDREIGNALISTNKFQTETGKLTAAQLLFVQGIANQRQAILNSNLSIEEQRVLLGNLSSEMYDFIKLQNISTQLGLNEKGVFATTGPIEVGGLFAGSIYQTEDDMDALVTSLEKKANESDIYVVPQVDPNQLVESLRMIGGHLRDVEQSADAASGAIRSLFKQGSRTQAIVGVAEGFKDNLYDFVKNGKITTDQYTSYVKQMEASSFAFLRNTRNLNYDEAQAQLAIWEGYWEDYFKMYDDAEEKTKKSTKSIESALSTALMSRRTVTDEDKLLTSLGKYQDAPLENARRLDAIIARGFSEIQAHPEWADILRIPPDVLSGTEGELKAWAIQTNKLVGAGASVQDVNWDAFLAEYETNLRIAQGKADVLKVAAQKVYEAGLAGSVSEAKSKVQEFTGDAEAVKVTPKFAADDIAQSFETAFVNVNFGNIINGAMKKQQQQIRDKGKVAGAWFGSGFSSGVESGLSGLVESIVAGLLSSANSSPNAPTGTVTFDD